MRRVRVPDRIVAGLAPGTILADFARAAREGEPQESLAAVWPADLTGWFFGNGLHEGDEVEFLPKIVPNPPPEPPDLRRERDRARRAARRVLALGSVLVLASVPLGFLAAHWFAGIEDLGGPIPWPVVLVVMALPSLPAGVLLATAVSLLIGIAHLDALWALPLLALALLPPSLVALLGFALISRARGRPTRTALLGIFGLLVPAREGAARSRTFL